DAGPRAMGVRASSSRPGLGSGERAAVDRAHAPAPVLEHRRLEELAARRQLVDGEALVPVNAELDPLDLVELGRALAAEVVGGVLEEELALLTLRRELTLVRVRALSARLLEQLGDLLLGGGGDPLAGARRVAVRQRAEVGLHGA